MLKSRNLVCSRSRRSFIRASLAAAGALAAAVAAPVSAHSEMLDVEKDAVKAADNMLAHVEANRKKLGI